jgi:hypothetical protein
MKSIPNQTVPTSQTKPANQNQVIFCNDKLRIVFVKISEE